MKKEQLLIIGAGPAGLAAAQVALKSGVHVKLFDDNPHPGGQFFRKSSIGSSSCVANELIQKQAKMQYARFSEVIRHPKIEYYPNTTIWGRFENNCIAYTQAERSGSLSAENIIIAAGAYDTVWPFPGWTMPGIITAGAALNLIKGQKIFPRGRTIVCGNGPLVLVAAFYLSLIGADLTHVIESSGGITPRCFSPNLFYEIGNLLKALRYYGKLYRTRVQMLFGQTIVEATGTKKVETATFAPLKSNGQIDLRKKWFEHVDNIVVSCGLVPSSELAKGFGCKTFYNEKKKYWGTVRNEEMETSISGIFSVGDCANIIGAKGSILEGQLAGLVVSKRMGKITNHVYKTQARKIKSKLMSYRKFNAALNQYFKSSHDILSTITDETIVCRCEDVTSQDIYELIRNGADNLIRLKGESRASMGRCQGRNCLRIIAHMLSRETNIPFKDIDFPSPRPPYKPVLIKDLLYERLPPQDAPTMKLP